MVEKPYIITIDGKSGVGKSELSEKLTKSVPKELNLTCAHFDTGTFFRAISCSFAIDKKNIDLMSEDEINTYLNSWPFTLEFSQNEIDKQSRIKYYKEIDGEKTELNDQMLRSEESDFMASKLGRHQVVAKWMEEERKKLVFSSGIDVVIINGRDTAANYFPEADLKIILAEDERFRARRRALERTFSGEANIETEKVKTALLLRDEKDAVLLQHNSSLSGVWEIDRTGLSSKRLSELVTHALGVVTGTEAYRLDKAVLNRWVAVNDGESKIATSSLDLEKAFFDPVLAFAIFGMNDLHRVVQKHVGGNTLATEIIYK